ncbi:hypothetical protein K7X08_000926 [Anisodus acutangulus]|uniref:Uncharacterized protein n=1 Tax=Anisodus acutangulus TaxID=402998 RepID=A0A9Q1MRR5_9SOLA|nr:hypothetical protein K7X08_000926 [Anisodus acutangulus]
MSLKIDGVFDLDLALTVVEEYSSAAAELPEPLPVTSDDHIEMPTVSAVGFCSICMEEFQAEVASIVVDLFAFKKENFKQVAIKEEMNDKETTIIMGQIRKFVVKEISAVVEPLKIYAEQYHKLLHTKLDGFEVSLAAHERSGLGGDVGKLREKLRQLRAAVQARCQVILEDLTLMTQEDKTSLIRVEKLIDDEDFQHRPKARGNRMR